VLNARFSHSTDVEDLVARVLVPKDRLSDYISTYTTALKQRTSRKGKKLSDKTLAEYEAQLGKVTEALGSKSVAQVTRRDVASFLEQFPATYRNRFRSLLNGLFAHAVAEGLRDDNPVAGTLKATEVVARPRLTMAEFIQTYRRAPVWLRRAMSFALRTLQRRADIVSWTTEQNVKDGCLLVTQSKTGARLRLKMDHRLAKLVARSTGYLVQKDDAPVSPDMLTRAFQEYRPANCGATFHEIRALGARLLRDRGVDPQPLLGHADPQMTRWYLDRHEIKWAEIELT
jgi:integrase